MAAGLLSCFNTQGRRTYHLACATMRAIIDSYIASTRTEAMKLLSRPVEVACFDPQVALIFLRMCGGYCKLVHLARATPPSTI